MSAILAFFGSKLGKYAAVALGVLILVAVIWWQIDRYGDSRYQQGIDEMRAAIEEANRRFEQQKARADGLAAERRLQDTMSINRQEEELRDAIASTPDTVPDAVRQRLACERLRRVNSESAARIPACRGPSG
jgi:hypothetical protein